MDLATFGEEYGGLLDVCCGAVPRPWERKRCGKILADIADKAPGGSTQDIVSRNLTESTQKLVKKLRRGVAENAKQCEARSGKI
jgi:hypothetical protein